MNREIRDIIQAFKEASAAAIQSALATVVHVDGSSYRRPGARMLVTENGQITGAISGGCLEGDALLKAQLAMHEKKNTLVTYNTMDDEDAEFGVQLGCNGIVHILFEPIDTTIPNNPIELLEACCMMRENAVLVTLFSLSNRRGHQPGTCFYFNGHDSLSQIKNNNLEKLVNKDAVDVLKEKNSSLKQYVNEEFSGFVEFMPPPVSLIIIGAGNDAMPLIDMATVLGWPVTLVGGRSSHANKKRFPKSSKILVAKPEEAVRELLLDDRTAVVLMTHNYNYDLAVVKELLGRTFPYLGMLGPKKRWERILNDLSEQGVKISSEQLTKVFGPTGLDIGAETAEEIGISILAEIKAVFAGREGSSLRDKKQTIHSREEIVTIANQ